MQIIKRSNALEVEKISNGFVVHLNGYDSSGEYLNERVFAENLDKVQDISDQYFKLQPC